MFQYQLDGARLPPPGRTWLLPIALVEIDHHQQLGPFIAHASAGVGNAGLEVGVVAFGEEEALVAVFEFHLTFQDVDEFLPLVLEEGGEFVGGVDDEGLHVLAGFAGGQDLVVVADVVAAFPDDPALLFLGDDDGQVLVGAGLRFQHVGDLEAHGPDYLAEGGVGRGLFRAFHLREITLGQAGPVRQLLEGHLHLGADFLDVAGYGLFVHVFRSIGGAGEILIGDRIRIPRDDRNRPRGAVNRNIPFPA